MKHHNNSSKLNKEYLCEYTDIFKLNEGTKVQGYKLVIDTTENYYSVGTGLYRYQLGKVKRRISDYSKLYRNTKYFRSEFSDKTAVFLTIEDLDNFYPGWREDDKVCVLKIILGGDTIKAVAKNQFYQCDVYAGSVIESIERYKL